MGSRANLAVLVGLTIVGPTSGCGDDTPSSESRLAALMNDGDLGAMAADARAPQPSPPPPRYCPEDCSRAALANWTLDDCNTTTTQLGDSSFTSQITHPAFRAVSAACSASIINQGIRLAGADDIVYAPDQPDFLFDGGLTIALWVNPDRVTGTQSIVRKRFDGSSSFLLAIDDKEMNFVLRLTSGRVVGVNAPIQARRFTHVAATYDGQHLVLTLDGVVAARTRAVGTIKAGAGPILIGNDADGRQMKGTVDEIWLNNLAAPIDVIRDLNCVHHTPQISLSPRTSAPQVAGTVVPFDLKLKNQDSAFCTEQVFEYSAYLPFPLSSNDDTGFGQLTLAAGKTAHATINVKSARSATVGSYPFEVFATNLSNGMFFANTTATYVVGTGPVACDGSPPNTNRIIGDVSSPAGAPFSFAAPGLAAPAVTLVPGPNGQTQSVAVAVNPGLPTDANNAFLGFGFGFGNPGCVDASRYAAVRFTVTGDLGTCSPTFGVIVSQDNSTAFGPFGTCTGSVCVSPTSGPITTGVNVVRFADMTGGVPLATVDPTALNGVQWTMTAPSDGVTAPCVANFTITNVVFVNEAGQQITYDFASSTQGWVFNTFEAPPFTNLAARPPMPGPLPPRPPFITLNFSDGDPAPAALVVGAPFTALDQYVNPIAVLPATDLSGRTLHARIKLLQGGVPGGGVQFHALSGADFAFAATFLGADQFPLGVWVPVALDLDAAAAATPGFDPTQIVQIGVQFYSGFSSSGVPFTSNGLTVYEIDTVTD